MKKIANIGSLLKKTYRTYNTKLLHLLQQKGFTDLRPSFLEVLLYICEQDGPSIKSIGLSCNLKKQTMTGHLNELEKRNYIIRKTSELDKREQKIYLTEYGESFRFNLYESVNELENQMLDILGEVELDRIELLLVNLYNKLTSQTG
ncbi:MAG: MarR family transcriptional regulator [Bacteriovoracaceae bacterium]|nr:MarR family transcriptional regulator [Bacteriovoracaceae bacterium]